MEGGKRNERIWRDGDILVWIEKREGEDLKGRDFEGLSLSILLTSTLHKRKDLEEK